MLREIDNRMKDTEKIITKSKKGAKPDKQDNENLKRMGEMKNLFNKVKSFTEELRELKSKIGYIQEFSNVYGEKFEVILFGNDIRISKET